MRMRNPSNRIMMVEGIPFEVEQEDGYFLVGHNEAGLWGVGKTLLDAEMDARYTAGMLMDEAPEIIRPFPLMWDVYAKVAIHNYKIDGECQCSGCRDMRGEL